MPRFSTRHQKKKRIVFRVLKMSDPTIFFLSFFVLFDQNKTHE